MWKGNSQASVSSVNEEQVQRGSKQQIIARQPPSDSGQLQAVPLWQAHAWSPLLSSDNHDAVFLLTVYDYGKA